MSYGCGDWYCVGNLYYIFERIAACCALAAVVTCIIFTITTSIGIGVGIGYNYCLVEEKTGEATEPPPPDDVDGRQGAKGLKTSVAENSTKLFANKFRRKSKFRPSMRTLEWRKNLDNDSGRLDETSLHFDHDQHLETKQSPPLQQPNAVMVVPLISQANISSIISKILSSNENVTVQFISM